jgi:hypothetical protein
VKGLRRLNLGLRFLFGNSSGEEGNLRLGRRVAWVGDGGVVNGDDFGTREGGDGGLGGSCEEGGQNQTEGQRGPKKGKEERDAQSSIGLSNVASDRVSGETHLPLSSGPPALNASSLPASRKAGAVGDVSEGKPPGGSISVPSSE